jgi:hypothetical protein
MIHRCFNTVYYSSPYIINKILTSMYYTPSFSFATMVALVLATIVFFSIAPIAFAQTVNYYSSVNPNPTGNPSVTNTIIPGAVNIPTGQTTGFPSTPQGGVTQTPGVPNTGMQSAQTPGVPNTGFGGSSSANLFVMMLSALLIATGIQALYYRRKN